MTNLTNKIQKSNKFSKNIVVIKSEVELFTFPGGF